MTKKINHKKILLVFLAIMTIGIFYQFFTLLSFPDSSIVLQKGDLIPLPAKQTLTQTFVANRNNLEKIEFLLRTPGVKSPDVVEISLADETCAKIIRKNNLEPSFLASDNLYDFKFSKVPDSNGKTYCIIATFKPNSKTKNVQLFSMDSQNSDLKNISTNQTYNDKTLSIRPSYSNDHWWQNLSELTARMSQYKPWFLKHYFLEAIILLFVFLTVSAAIILITI